MQFLIAGTFAFGVLLVFVALARSVSAPTRVGTVATQYGKPFTLEEIQFSEPFSQRALWPALRRVAQLMTRFTPQQVIETTRQKLDLAGNPGDIPVVEFLGLRAAVAVLTALLLALVFTMLKSPLISIIVFMGVGLSLGFYLPLLWLNLRIRDRQNDIQLALADALDLLTVCVEAGMGLDSAMGQVAEKWDNHLSRAFGRVLHELRLGKPKHAALRDMAERGGVRDLTNFVAALIQAEQHGAPIARVLRVQSDQMRVLRRQRAQERANQMPIRLLFPLIFFIFPAIFVVLLGPAVLRLMKGFV